MKFSFLMSISKIRNYITESISSALEQNYSNEYEIVIINDGIKDNELEKYIEKAFSTHNKYKIIKIFKNKKNIGLTKSLNHGINLCRGHFIVRLDDDDLSEKNRLSELEFIINKDNLIMLISSSFYKINDRGNIIGKKILTVNKLLSKYKYKNILGHSSICFNKQYIKEIGLYNENFYCSQDFELWNRCIIKNKKNIFISKKILVKIRQHKDTVSHKNSFAQRFNSIKVCLASKYTSSYQQIVNLQHDDIDSYISNLQNVLLKKDYEALRYCYFYEQNRRPNINYIILIHLISVIYFKNPQLLFHKANSKIFNFKK